MLHTRNTAGIEDQVVTLTEPQTLDNKTLADHIAVRTTALSLATGDVTLSATQASAGILEVSTGHATNAIIAPSTAGQMYWVVNNDATLVANIKKTGGIAVTVAATKKALVYFNGTDYTRLTADQ